MLFYFLNIFFVSIGLLLAYNYINRRLSFSKLKIILPDIYKFIISLYNKFLKIVVIVAFIIVVFFVFVSFFSYFFPHLLILKRICLKLIELYYLPYDKLNEFLLNFRFYMFLIKQLILIIFFF